MVQLHKKFNDDQVRELLKRYIDKKIGRKYVQDILGIKKTRLFALVKQLKEDPDLTKNLVYLKSDSGIKIDS